MFIKPTCRATMCALAATLAAGAGLLAAGPAHASPAQVEISPGSPYDQNVDLVNPIPGVAPKSGSSYVATAWLSGTATGTLCLEGNCTDYSVTAGAYSMEQVVYDPHDLSGSTMTFVVTATSGTAELENASVEPSMVESGSFEGSYTGWAKLIPSGASVNMALYNTADGAPATAHDGTGYLAFNSNPAGGGVAAEAPWDDEEGSAYVATAWLSSQSGTATGSLCVGLAGVSTGNCEPYTVTAGTYTEVQLVYDVPAGTSVSSTLEVQLEAGQGTTDLDTASLALSTGPLGG
jgi:hypothetical protein